MSKNRLPVTLMPDVPYGMAGGAPLLLDILRPESPPPAPMPAVVEIHGGGWAEGEKDALRNRFFAERGYFTVSINYRLSSEAIFPAQAHDAKAAVRWLRAHASEYGVDPDRVGVWGHSAGGHLAALLGTSADVVELEGDQAGRAAPAGCRRWWISADQRTRSTRRGRRSRTRMGFWSSSSAGRPPSAATLLARQTRSLTYGVMHLRS